MSDTATEAERSRDDDRASYKDTHGLSPIRSVCIVMTLYAFARECCDTWDTGEGENTGSAPLNPLKKGAGRNRGPLHQCHSRPAGKAGNPASYGQISFHRPKTPCFQKQLG